MKLMKFDLSGLLNTFFKSGAATTSAGDTVLVKIIVQLVSAKR